MKIEDNVPITTPKIIAKAKLRTYLGHPIPKDAPPRPDRSAVWDEVHWKWGN